MKKSKLFFTMFVMLNISLQTFAQNVGISSAVIVPDASSMLEVRAANKGLLIPQVPLTGVNDAVTIASPATSLLVYCTGTGGLSPAGYYYNSGTPALPNWIRFLTNNNGDAWLLLGNAGTIDDISLTGNFLGTTDNKPLSFRVNNLHAGRIETGAGASVYLGSQAGNSSVATGYNTGIGYQALFSNNSSATTNTAVGYKALFANVNGSSNTAVGEGVLQNNTSGSNTAIGSEAMMFNTSGGNNTATGLQALQNNTTGNWNTATGFQALQANNGSMNSAIGFMALARNTSGSYNTANGSQALFSNLTGSNNTATGYNASNANVTGTDNAAMGYEALQNNTYGGRNTAIGSLALFTQSYLNGSVAWNTENTAVGYKALYTNQPDGGGGGLNGLYNTALGSQALRSNTIGSSNTAVGYVALPTNTTGQQNVAVGYASLQSNSTGSFNTACGMYACNSTTGSQNTGLGFGTLYNATGQINTAVGMQALYNTSSGNFNTALGANAGSTNTTGSNNTYIGNSADASANGYTNSTAIGNGASITASNMVVLGNTAITATKFSGALMPYYGATYNAGTIGQVLTSQGAGLAPQWMAAAAGIDATAWHITGNTGTTASTSAIGVAVNNNFIGTTDTKDWVMATNNLERMRISSAGNVGINTITPTATFLLTINPTTNAIRSGIDMTLTGATSTAYGLNITTANLNVNGILVTHSSGSLASSLYGVGAVLSSTNIVSGYCGYRTNSGNTYGIYGINGTNALYATNANTWAAFIQGRAVISSESSPTSLLGTDLEIRNTTTGAAAPVTVSMRQTTQLSVTNNVLANINFGDNYVTTPQAQIQVLRDAAASSAADMPTAITFSTTADASAVLTERMRIANSGNVGIGTAAPDASAKLDITSTVSGLLVPRMTTAQRNAIVAPAEALLIYNLTTKCFEFWENGLWQTLMCACSAPAAPVATAASAITATAFNANWNASAGATGYYLDVATNAGFTIFVAGYNSLNVGNVLTFNVSGLTCNTTYYFRVRAYNACGTSVSSNTITITTAACAACTVNQSQLLYQGGESARNLAGYSTWQSFTPSVNGSICQIDQGFFNAMTGTATLKIYFGTGNGGALLYSQGITITGAGNFWQTFTISPVVPVLAGQVYTFEVVPIQGGGLPDPYGVQVSGPANTYVGGQCEFGATWDDVFRVYLQ